MKRAILGIALMTMSAVGCGSSKKGDLKTDTAVTDVTPSLAPAPMPAYTPAPAPAPMAYDTSTPQLSSPSMSGSSTYTVKKGDTLYSIARSHYGDGKQWNKIASANPGLKPETLKVGQKITLP